MAEKSKLEKLKTILSRACTQNGKIPIRNTPIYIALIGYINYFSLYFLRKSQTTTKTLYLEEFFGNSTSKDVYGGWMDNAYLIPYAVGQVLYPNAVDYLGSRVGWLVCLLPASISLVLVKFVQTWWQLTLCLCCTAMAQSLCWPAAVKMLSKYMTNEQYKLLLPIWGSCVFVGNVMGNLLSAFILDSAECDLGCLDGYTGNMTSTLFTTGNPTVSQLKSALNKTEYANISSAVFNCRENNWRDVFWMPACAPVIISILTFLLSPDDRPENDDNLITINTLDLANQKILDDSELANLKVDPAGESKSNEQSPEASPEVKIKQEKEVPSMLYIAKNATVGWFLALGYFCVKGGRYWAYYWSVPLMTNLTNNRWDEAEGARQNSFLDTGGMISSFVLPMFLMTYTFPCCKGKKFYLRPLIICLIVCTLAVPTLLSLVYVAIPSENKTFTSILWFIFGFLLGIPDNLYSGIAVNELATYMGGNIQASLAGFVNGLGGFGPFVGSPLTGTINKAYGKQTGSWVVIGFMAVGAVVSIIADIFMVKKKSAWEKAKYTHKVDTGHVTKIVVNVDEESKKN